MKRPRSPTSVEAETTWPVCTSVYFLWHWDSNPRSRGKPLTEEERESSPTSHFSCWAIEWTPSTPSAISPVLDQGETWGRWRNRGRRWIGVTQVAEESSWGLLRIGESISESAESDKIQIQIQSVIDSSDVCSFSFFCGFNLLKMRTWLVVDLMGISIHRVRLVISPERLLCISSVPSTISNNSRIHVPLYCGWYDYGKFQPSCFSAPGSNFTTRFWQRSQCIPEILKYSVYVVWSYSFLSTRLFSLQSCLISYSEPQILLNLERYTPTMEPAITLIF